MQDWPGYFGSVWGKLPRDTLELLGRGWRVVATDGHPDAFTYQWPRVPDALTFCEPRHLPVLRERLVAAIRPGGRFAGRFFGDRDSWASLPHRTHHSPDELLALLEPFAIEMMRVDERDDGSDVQHPTHWQLFHVVAKKR